MRKRNVNSDRLIVIPLKGDNQGFITLTYEPVFYSKTKYIYILHYYILDKVLIKRIELAYILIDKIISYGIIKTLI